MFTYKSLSSELNDDEYLWVLSVEDVQDMAQDMLNRKLNYDEIYSVKKGIEWGMWEWKGVVKAAIENLKYIDFDNE